MIVGDTPASPFTFKDSNCSGVKSEYLNGSPLSPLTVGITPALTFVLSDKVIINSLLALTSTLVIEIPSAGAGRVTDTSSPVAATVK